MNAKKQTRRKPSAAKLEPIDWREFANDAVLNGNMSTLYRRPPTEDPTTYASDEAMVEIEKRIIRPEDSQEPTVGPTPTAGTLENPEGASSPDCSIPTDRPIPTDGSTPTVVEIPTGPAEPSAPYVPTASIQPTAPFIPTVGISQPKPTAPARPTVSEIPTVGPTRKRRIKPIRDVQDALTLAGQVLYRAMLGDAGDARATSCTKGYRQLAAETRLDKDTVRDLIVEFKEKGLVRETATYDADTRSSKTYEVLSHQAALALWHDAGIAYVTTGRQRPLFCSSAGELLELIPTVGIKPTRVQVPTVGMEPSET
jgi:hypothetical protein